MSSSSFWLKTKAVLAGRNPQVSQLCCTPSPTKSNREDAALCPVLPCCVGNTHAGWTRRNEDVDWLGQTLTWLGKAKNLLGCMCLLVGKWKPLPNPEPLSGRDGALCILQYHQKRASFQHRNQRCQWVSVPSALWNPLATLREKNGLAGNILVSVPSQKDGCWLPHYVLQLLSKETHWKKSTTKWNRS